MENRQNVNGILGYMAYNMIQPRASRTLPTQEFMDAFELFENGKSEYNVQWLRKMMSVTVYPSLTVAASLSPSHYGRQQDYLPSIVISDYIVEVHPVGWNNHVFC